MAQKTLADFVCNQIMLYIQEQGLQAGDALPSEQELAEKMHVNRSTVREAIKLLISRNIVEIRRGRGTFVCDHTGQTEDPLGLSYQADPLLTAKELADIRLHLEPWIASLAAQNITPKEEKKLQEYCSRVEWKIQNGENHCDEDKEFHSYLAKCTHNRIIARLLPIINHSVSIQVEITASSMTAMTVRTHREITDAVCNHDIEGARLAMLQHLIPNRNSLLYQIENRER